MPAYGASPQLPMPQFGGQRPMSREQAGGLFGAGGALLGKLFGGNNNPADAAMDYFSQIPGVMKPYYNPYIQAGQGALGHLQGQYGQLTGQLPGLQDAIARMMSGQAGLQGEYGKGMGLGEGLRGQYGELMSNPAEVMNRIGKGYQESPGFKFATDRATQAANAAAAAGGMLGSPAHQQELAQQITGMANQDYGNYLQNAMGLYNRGIQGAQGLYNQGIGGQQGMFDTGFGGRMGLYGKGLEGFGDINKMGYNASNELAQSLANALMSQGQLAYSGQAAENQGNNSFWGDLFGGASKFALPFFGL